MERRAAYITHRLPEREADIVQTIVEGLALLGYEVLRCGQRRADLAGSDSGLPDIWITRDTWPTGCWLGIEVKGTHTRLSLAQRRLCALRRIVVCRCWEDALAAIADFEQRLLRMAAPGV
jgi:hypothetical protein